MAVHHIAARGFGGEADAYERSRPSYPPDAVAYLIEQLRIGPGTTVIDLAAGTGKLTRLLAPTGARLIAVEPVDGMRRVFVEAVPGIPVVAGTAEAQPFADARVEAVTVAQAFHWFDADAAFAELARIIRRGGRVGVIWNARDRSVPWVDAAWSIMDRVEKEAPWRDHEHWKDSAFGRRRDFGALHEATFQHAQPYTPEGVVERFRGVSHVAALPPARRDEVLSEVRELLATHRDTRGRGELAIPHRVDTYWCERQ